MSWAVSHFSKSISQTTTSWELVLGLLGIRVILRGKLGFYSRSQALDKWSWRSGALPFHNKMYTFIDINFIRKLELEFFVVPPPHTIPKKISISMVWGVALQKNPCFRWHYSRNGTTIFLFLNLDLVFW